jgi:hypothetical protein
VMEGAASVARATVSDNDPYLKQLAGSTAAGSA